MFEYRRALKFFKMALVPISLYLICLIWIFLNQNLEVNKQKTACGIYGCIDDNLDFEGFDNINGVNMSIVPNIVHLIYLNETKIKFYQMICIFSIYFNHNPELIYFHCDDCSFHGKYWEQIKSNKGLWSIIKIHKIPLVYTLFGIRSWINNHRLDIWRLQVECII
jgi:hypothetical protein